MLHPVDCDNDELVIQDIWECLDHQVNGKILLKLLQGFIPGLWSLLILKVFPTQEIELVIPFVLPQNIEMYVSMSGMHRKILEFEVARVKLSRFQSRQL